MGTFLVGMVRFGEGLLSFKSARRLMVTTPIPSTAIFEIKAHINRILKILPKSKLTLTYNASQTLKQTIT